jgi:hypothetical protein
VQQILQQNLASVECMRLTGIFGGFEKDVLSCKCSDICHASFD